MADPTSTAKNSESSLLGQFADRVRAERLRVLDEQLTKLAEVGAALCTYLPGAGHPDEWPEARCDCKYLPELSSVLWREYSELGSFTSETTGCCEVRSTYLTLKALRDHVALRGQSGDS